MKIFIFHTNYRQTLKTLNLRNSTFCCNHYSGFHSRVQSRFHDLASESINLVAFPNPVKGNCYEMMLLTGSKEESKLNFYRKARYNSEDKTAFIQWISVASETIASAP